MRDGGADARFGVGHLIPLCVLTKFGCAHGTGKIHGPDRFWPDVALTGFGPTCLDLGPSAPEPRPAVSGTTKNQKQNYVGPNLLCFLWGARRAARSIGPSSVQIGGPLEARIL